MAKVRVYELAKELGLESKDLLKTLQDMGYADVKNLARFQDWVEAGGEAEKT